MSEHTFLMVRDGKWGRVENAAMLTISTRNPDTGDDDAAFTRFKAGVFAWVRDTKEGQEAWDASVSDLNIGDILTYGHHKEQTLKDSLTHYGITIEQLVSLDFSKQIQYDEQLADGEVLCAHCDEMVQIYDAACTDGVWSCGCKEVKP